MTRSNKSKILVDVPEELLGFAIQELVSEGGVIDCINSIAAERAQIEALIPATAYDSVVKKISEYVAPGKATFERNDL